MSTEITTDITGDDTIKLVAFGADGYGHIPGTAIATALGIDQSVDFEPALGRPEVVVAAASNITLSGEQTIEGVACVAGDRVLLTAQTDAKQNRPYVVAAGAWSAAGDNLANGTWWTAPGGNNGPRIWVLTTADPITPGTTELALASRLTASAPHAFTHGSGQSDAITIAQSQVTNLVSDLAAKSATSHTHGVILFDPVVIRATGQTVAGDATIDFDTEIADPAGKYSVSSDGEVTCTDAGTYWSIPMINHIPGSGSANCPLFTKAQDNRGGSFADVANSTMSNCALGVSTAANSGITAVGINVHIFAGAGGKIRYRGGLAGGYGSAVIQTGSRLFIAKVA